jgi:colanic acid biosynthesis glycosyl transferase WcaI
MRICIVSQYFWPERFRINDIAQGLIEKGHEVVVLTGLPNYPEGKFSKGYGILGPYREKIEGVEVVRVPLFTRGENRGWRLVLNYLSFFFFASLLAPFVIRGRIDRIFVYQLSPVLAAFPALVLKFVKKAPIILWVTDLWPESLEATGTVQSEKALKLWGRVVKFLYDRCDKILVSSKGFIPKIQKRGIPLDKLSYWPQWGELLFAENRILPDLDISSELPSGFIVMFAGNIGTSQSFDTIIDAATLLRNEEEIKWVILGDGLMQKWVKQEVEKRGLEKQVFLLGSRPVETMPTYYSKADALLASLKKDPLFAITVPAKIQSYLPSGKPIIASMDGEGAELIRDSKAGVASEASNPQDLSEKVLELYKMSETERSEMGNTGKEYFKNNFQRDDLLNYLDELMRTIV